MILTDEEITERLESPLNLMNRLRRATESITPSNSNFIPSFPPTSDQLIQDLQDKINGGTVKTKANGILAKTLDELDRRLPEIQKPEKLAQIASEMSKVVNAQDNKNSGERSDKPQIIIYAPQTINESHYETMVVNE